MAPYRTGIPTILKMGKVICRLLVAFRPIVDDFLTAPQLQAWDNLLIACQAFESLIEHPNQGD
jgi:hypothetical protein